jgi:hypothetical protein
MGIIIIRWFRAENDHVVECRRDEVHLKYIQCNQIDKLLGWANARTEE